MDSSDIIKKYWPYLVGGAIGLYFIVGKSGASSDNGYSAFFQAQTAAQTAASQQAYQQAVLQAQVDAQNSANALEAKKLEAQTNVAYLQAQASMANAVTSGASQVVAALYAPTVTAINAAGYENAAALNAAATVASGGFNAQSKMVSSLSQTVQGVGTGLSGIWQGVGESVAAISKNSVRSEMLQNLTDSANNLGAIYGQR